jgi:type IV pilus assembly protein PilM
MDDLSLDYQILDVDLGTKMQVLLVAAKRDLILSRVEIIREAGLAVEAVDVNCFALQNALEHGRQLGAEETVALLNIGADITNVNVVRGGLPLYTQDLSLGSHSFVQSVQKAFHLSRAEADKALQENPCRLDVAPLLEQFCADLWGSLEKSLNYLRTSGEADHLDRVLLSGGGAQIEGLVERLASRPETAVALADPLRGLSWGRGVFAEGDPARVAPRLAVGLGLALRKERAK